MISMCLFVCDELPELRHLHTSSMFIRELLWGYKLHVVITCLNFFCGAFLSIVNGCVAFIQCRCSRHTQGPSMARKKVLNLKQNNFLGLVMWSWMNECVWCYTADGGCDCKAAAAQVHLSEALFTPSNWSYKIRFVVLLHKAISQRTYT